jgi:hypothetical protein
MYDKDTRKLIVFFLKKKIRRQTTHKSTMILTKLTLFKEQNKPLAKLRWSCDIWSPTSIIQFTLFYVYVHGFFGIVSFVRILRSMVPLSCDSLVLYQEKNYFYCFFWCLITLKKRCSTKKYFPVDREINIKKVFFIYFKKQYPKLKKNNQMWNN